MVEGTNQKTCSDAELIVESLVNTKELLQRRYDECDSEGHKKPSGNYCNYCYRHLMYFTPETDAKLRKRKNTPLKFQPCDAPIILKEKQEEIKFQKFYDLCDGVKRITEELTNSGELERKMSENDS